MSKKSWLNTLIINFENYFKFKKTKRLHDPIFLEMKTNTLKNV